MAFVVKDRVRETTLTTGTGTITLAGAVIGYQTFSAIGDGNNTFYTIAGQATSEWEVGIGTYTASGTTLSRDTILASSNSGSAVNFSAGTKDVFVTYPAGKAIFQNNLDSVVVAANTSSDALRITQTGSGNALLVEDSANPDATPFVVNAVGQVLFGNTTSISYQTMGLAYNSGKAQIAGADGNTSSQLIAQYNTGSTVAIPTIVFAKSKNATVGSHTIVASGDSLGAVSYDGSDGTNFIEAARVWAQVDGTPGTNDMPGRLVFSTTADGASSPTERMRIDSAGRVGIGIAPATSTGVYVNQATTDAVAYGFLNTQTAGSSTTNTLRAFQTSINTSAASFTLGSLNHYFASQGSLGAGSSVTNQLGFVAASNLTGATNNYGFYSDIASGTGRWNFYAAGTASNYFGGNTIINVADNTNAALRITQTGTGNALVVEDSANPDSTPFVVNADGRVLSGLTTPITTLFGNIPGVQINAQFGVQAMACSRFSADQFGADIDFVKSRNATVGSQTVLVSGDQIANLNFAGSDGTQFVNAASIAVNIDGTPGTNDMPGRLVFSTTADGASSATERMRIDNAGSVGIGATSLTGWNLRVSKNITGGTSGFGVGSDGSIQSGVTSAARMFISQPSTAAAAFTLPILDHYLAAQGTIGAGSTVTNQYGFSVSSTLTGATNNYGFYSDIASGTGRYNFYANGTADNYFAGRVGIGTAPESDTKVVVGGTLPSNASSSKAYTASFFVPSSSTSTAYGFLTYVNTSATAFTLSNLYHYQAIQGTVGAGSAITNQFGFLASSTLTGATNNIGFYSDIASGTGRWNFYAGGTADNYFAGSVGIGGTPIAGFKVSNYGNLSGATTAYSYYAGSTFQSDVTTNGIGFGTFLGTQAASFTLTSLTHFRTAQGTFGAGSAVTNQFGFEATNTLTGATNNFGFYSNIASGTGRWNFYAAGTAQNYFAGTTLIGTTTNTNTSTLVVNGTISQTVSGTQYLVVDQSDIGTGANEIPLNQYLGANAYVDTETPALNVGTGITTGTGTICKANGGLSGGIYRMTILIDLTGLNSGGTAGDIIGVNGTALPCYIAQLPAMTVLGGRMTCLETPAGGDTDIDLYSATEGTGVEDQAITALTETEIINAGAQTRGTVTYFSADPATNAYFYFVGQGTANATYTAGRFLIEIFGVQ